MAGAGQGAVDEARAQTARASRTRTFERGARAGLIARGVVYVLIGWLAVKVAVTGGGETADQEEVLKEIAQQSLGTVLLVLVAVGLAGYAIWRLTRAALGHGPEDSDSTFDRIGALFSGIGYALLCAVAIGILVGSGSSGSGPTGGVLDWTGGVYLVGIAGIATILEGLEQGYRGISEKFAENAKVDEMSSTTRTWYGRIGTFGHLSRMVVFVLIGYFLLKAAIDYDPDAAVSIDGALSKLAQASYGPWLLGIVAFGLISFGLYSILDSRYRKV